MFRVRLKELLLALAAMLVGLAPMQLLARPIAPASTCHTSAGLNESYAAVLRSEGRWICKSSGFDVSPDSLFLRYQLNPALDGARARSFVAQVGPFEAITIWAVDARGEVRSQHYDRAAARHITAGPFMVMALPQTPSAPQRVVVRIDRPWTKTIASHAWLDSKQEGTGWDNGEMIAMALICGMLIAPLLLNLAFYPVLRRSYVLWNAGVTVCMLFQAMISTGFVHLLIDLDSYVEISIGTVSVASATACALMIGATFIEPECQSPRIRAMLNLAAPMVVAAAMISALPLEALRPYSMLIIYIDMALSIGLIVSALVDASRRRSRAVYFLIAGWAPVLLVAAYRIACYLLPTARPTESVVPFQLALAVNVLIISLGIIFRFVDLRVERDRARARAMELEDVAGHDPLTGLWNRRSIEQQFEELYAMGFRTMAVLDLDHFKSVNDQHGHGVGDTVLKAAASALSSDGDTRAVRMGGEEFLLLLRGADAADRAENSRRAISARVAAGVPGLDRIVTASMGLVEHDHRGPFGHAAFKVEFAALCAQCDRLLYEAKRLGRNRTMREKFTSFSSEKVPSAAAITR
jgi:diguanylate cyclase (GGDEF)-like protein